MKIFSFDPAEHRDHYSANGWAHIRGGASPAFLEALQTFADESFGAHEVEGKAIAGRKKQALFEAPEGVDFPGELFDVIAELCQLHRPTMTLSERHVKAYDHDAPPEPVPHKDRYASQVSIGVSIRVPEDSRLTLYPNDELDVNPLNVSAAYLESLAPERRPDQVLRGVDPVELYDQPGDVMMFAGNAVWHARRKPAGAINLYLKLNDFNCDPLGEDPTSSAVRRASVEAAESGDIIDRVPILGRRVDCISRRYTRHWEQAVHAELWEDAPVALSADDVALLEAVDGRATAAELLDEGAGEAPAPALRRLASRGVLDLL
jgi:hypothetical protein